MTNWGVESLSRAYAIKSQRLLDLFAQELRREPLTDPRGICGVAHSSSCAKICGATTCVFIAETRLSEDVPGPGGTSDSSPTFQRWVQCRETASPEGTAEIEIQAPQAKTQRSG